MSSPPATLELNKCPFYTDTIAYQIHSIQPKRLELASHTIDAIGRLNSPLEPPST